MCFRKPGPRCSKHARESLNKAVDSGNIPEILVARDNYDETREGQSKLDESIAEAKKSKSRVTELRVRKERAAARRVDKMERYKSMMETMASDTGSSAVVSIPLETAGGKKMSPETARKEAEKATKRYIGYISAFRDVDSHEVERTLLELKMEYHRKYASLPDDKRPDPPQEWVSSMAKSSGEGVAKLPIDPASRYAFYRAQFDPELFAEDPNRRYAVVDVETAEERFEGRPNPANGSIIEIGIVEYDAKGNKVSSWGQLIHPGKERGERIGTGAVEIHNITMDDVKDSPQWDEVKDEVIERLKGTTFVAHNAKFDSSYVGYHTTGKRYLTQPVIDTLSVSRINNVHLDNHKLATIAKEHGLIYDNGHRAEHDAIVCGDALFAMKRKMDADWKKSKCARIIAESN